MSDLGDIPVELVNLIIFVGNNMLNLGYSFEESVILIMCSLQLFEELFDLVRLVLNGVEVFALLLLVAVRVLILEIVLVDYLLVLRHFILQVLRLLLLVL